MMVVTNKFSDENFSRPRLAGFAFRFTQTKPTLRLAPLAARKAVCVLCDVVPPVGIEPTITA